MSLLKKIWELLFSNFMVLYVIMGLAVLAGRFVPVMQLLMISSFLYGVYMLTEIKKINSIDFLILVYFGYIIINIIGIDYPHHLRFIVQAFIFQICPLMCYFIARSNNLELSTVFNKMTIPIVFAMIVGLYCQISQPDWYSSIKWERIYDQYGANADSNSVFEQTRLSSIWLSSYYIAFASLFFSTYLLIELSFKELEQRKKIIYIILLLLSVIILFYANHRTTLLGFVISFLYCFAYGNNKNVKFYLAIAGIVIVVIVALIIFSSPEYLEFITMRFENVTTEEGIVSRLELTGGGQDLTTIFGNGYGRYSLRAREYGGWAIIDSEYQKHLGELGIVGFSLFILILINGLYNAVRLRKYAGLELCIFLFYLEAFIGASALSVDSEYSFIFWYALGKISKKSTDMQYQYSFIEEY